MILASIALTGFGILLANNVTTTGVPRFCLPAQIVFEAFWKYSADRRACHVAFTEVVLGLIIGILLGNIDALHPSSSCSAPNSHF